MEGHTVGFQAQVPGQNHQIQRHVRLAAELARQRPVGGVRAFGEDAHIHPGTRRRLGDVAQVRFRVGGEHAHALLVESADVAGLLDGVAENAALRRHPQTHHFFQLVDRGDIEISAPVTQQADQLSGRVRLYRVVHLGERKLLDQLIVVFAHGFRVDHHEGGLLGVRQVLDAAEHHRIVIIFHANGVDGHGGPLPGTQQPPGPTRHRDRCEGNGRPK